MSSLPPIVTPLVSAGTWRGTQLWVKDESRCPTGTFKDRLAWEYVAQVRSGMVAAGPQTVLTSITLGNTMRSFAHAVRQGLPENLRPRLAAIVPEKFAGRIIGPGIDGLACRGRDILDDLESSGVACHACDLRSGRLSEHDIVSIVSPPSGPKARVHNVTNGLILPDGKSIPAYRKIIEEALDAMREPPDRIVLPVGAGVLYHECIEVVEERSLPCEVLGVAVTEEGSIGDKIYGLYSPYYADLEKHGTAAYGKKTKASHRVIRITDEQIKAVRELPLPAGFERAEPSAWAVLVPLAGAAMGGTTLVVNTGSGILPPKTGVDQVLNVLRSARSDPVAGRIYDPDPLDGKHTTPLSVAEALGALSRAYFTEARAEGLVQGLVLSRMLLGYERSTGFTRTYDRVSKINSYGNPADSVRALHAILAYVKASEVLSNKPGMEPCVQLVRKLFEPHPGAAPKPGIYWPDGEERIYVFQPGTTSSSSMPDVQINGWEPQQEPHRAAARELIRQLIPLMQRHGLGFSPGDQATDDNAIYAEPLHGEATKLINAWWEKEGAKFAASEDPRILLLATMEELGPGWVFFGVPLPLRRLESFYRWAGQWCIMRPPTGTVLGASTRRDHHHLLNLIGRTMMAEIQGYVYRLRTWQRKILAENQGSYEVLAGREFLPRVLRRNPPSRQILIPVSAGSKPPIPLTDFLPQIPFGAADDLLLVGQLLEFLNMQKLDYLNRQKRAVAGLAHELQPRRIDLACASPEEFGAECLRISRRLRSLGLDSLDLDAKRAGTLTERKKYLRDVHDRLSILCDTREYLDKVIGEGLRERKGKFGDKFRYGFTHKVARTNLPSMSWKQLGAFYANPAEVHPLPFAIERVDRVVDALTHNFETWSAKGSSCELWVHETERYFEMQWREKAKAPAFANFDEFCAKAADAAPDAADHGIHRGLPLALLFGFESSVRHIGVWLGDLKSAGSWHNVFGPDEEAPSPLEQDTTYAISWRWVWTAAKPQTP